MITFILVVVLDYLVKHDGWLQCRLCSSFSHIFLQPDTHKNSYELTFTPASALKMPDDKLPVVMASGVVGKYD